MAPERPVASKRNRRRRARKRRPAQATAQSAEAAGAPPADAGAGAGAAASAKRAKRPTSAEARAASSSRTVGERPRAPWHPWPLSELLILIGGVGSVVAFKSGAEGHPALLVVGVVAVALGTFEVTLREHLAGYRSHTVLLAAIPVIAFHTAVILVGVLFIRVPRWANVPLLVLDVALFSFLYKLLRARYLDARRERVFAGAR